MQAEKFPNENFSDRFSALVAASPLSQKGLAEVLHVAESAIVNYKNGRIPKAEELLRIATHFRVQMEWLLTGNGGKTLSEAFNKWLEGLRVTNPKGFDEKGNFIRDEALLSSVKLHDSEVTKRALAKRADAAEAKLDALKKELKRIIKDI